MSEQTEQLNSEQKMIEQKMIEQKLTDYSASHQKLVAPTLHEAMFDALGNVLETMFFAEISPIDDAHYVHPSDALACRIECRGAHTGGFGVIVDKPAHILLCSGFYGEEEEDVSTSQMHDLIGELTNMLAGAALGLYTPEHLCALSSPVLCPSPTCDTPLPGQELTRCTVALDGGTLTLWCSLQAAL